MNVCQNYTKEPLCLTAREESTFLSADVIDSGGAPGGHGKQVKDHVFGCATYQEVPYTHRARCDTGSNVNLRVGIEITACLTLEIRGYYVGFFWPWRIGGSERDERLDVIANITITW